MTYQLDTTTFSDLMRENPQVRARIASLGPADQVAVCTVVRGEIQYGISRLPAGKRKQDLQTKANQLFAGVRCEAIPEAVADHYAAIKVERQSKGLTLDENDLWIAATSRAFGAVLVSRDKDFFAPISGLTVQDWTV